MHMHTCIYISPQLVHPRLCNSAAASLPWKLLRIYLESCANIVQAVAVVLHKHHLIIRVGAGLIQFVTLDKNLFSQPFSRVAVSSGTSEKDWVRL